MESSGWAERGWRPVAAMRSLAATLAIAWAIPVSADVRPAKYDIDLRLDPGAGRWAATVRATGIACKGATARLHLHREISITEAVVDGRRVQPVVAPPDAPQFWISAARSFDLPCPRRSLVLHYEGPGLLHPDGRNQVSAKLVELSLYGSWYPLVEIDDRISWRLTTVLPGGWRFATPAKVSQRGQRLRLRSDRPMDIVLIASPLLDEERVPAGGTVLRLLVNRALAAGPLAVAREQAGAAADMAAWASGVFGPPSASETLAPQLIFTPRGGSLSYSRLPLIIMRETDLTAPTLDRPALLNVRHEIAHFWSRAPQEVDWLNEGVAEYLALRRTGAVEGAGVMEGVIADYRRQIAAAGSSAPITAGSDERTFLNTYARPALLFDALARRHGAEEVEQLLAALFALGDGQSVDRLLALVAERFGAGEREIVAACLQSRDWSAPCGG